ncbi:MAG: hypothetical protein KAU10_08490, partial [Dehalococcoidia bacterium]|nr:hypothetical protein [Dehalococcoidia bacterium]
MNKALRIYPLVALLAATHFSPWPQSVIALALLLLALPFFFRKHLRWEIPIGLAYFFALPLLFQPVLNWLAPLLALPILPLISSSLRENARSRSIAPATKERELTLTAKSVMAAAGAVILVALILGHWTLAITGGTALLFVAAMLARVGRGLPVPPLEAQQEDLRLIAGNTGKPTIRLISRARFPLHVTISSSHSWIRLARESFVNLTGEAELELTVTPSLSGPVEPGLEVSCTDPWGLIQMRQTVKPIKLYVIPRARYAE